MLFYSILATWLLVVDVGLFFLPMSNTKATPPITVPVQKNNNEKNKNGACGQIELVLYGINTLRPRVFGKAVHIDKMFGLKHAGILVCGIEFHFGYEHLISICESPKVESSQITCTTEMNPQFDVEPDGGRVRIREQHYLKFGRIVSNLKTRRSQNEYRLQLLDTKGNQMRTAFSRQQIVQQLLNGQLRSGQQDFPRVELLNGGNQFRVWQRDGKTARNFMLPDGMDLKTWNEHAAIYGNNLAKTKNSSISSLMSKQAIEIYEELIELEAEFKAISVHANGGNNAMMQRGKFTTSNIDRVSNDLGMMEEEEDGNGGTGVGNNVEEPVADGVGRFKYGTYGKVLNNCVDFGVHFVAALSPSQQCDWPAVMSQLSGIHAFRFIYGMWINGLKILSKVPRLHKQIEQQLNKSGKSIEEFLSAEDNSLPVSRTDEYEEMDKCLGVGITTNNGDGTDDNVHLKSNKRRMINRLLNIGMAVAVLGMYPVLMHNCMMPSADYGIGNVVSMLMVGGSANHQHGGIQMPAGHGNHQIWHNK